MPIYDQSETVIELGDGDVAVCANFNPDTGVATLSLHDMCVPHKIGDVVGKASDIQADVRIVIPKPECAMVLFNAINSCLLCLLNDAVMKAAGKQVYGATACPQPKES